MKLFNFLKQYSSLEDLPRFANRQGVAALLYDEVVGSGENPFDKRGLMRLSGYAQKQAKKWEMQKESIASLARFCEHHGVKMMVFKGYALSLMFDKPESRKSGDVDVFFFELGQQTTDYGQRTIKPAGEKVDRLLREKGVIVTKTIEKHTVFDIKGTHYENHNFFLDSNDHERLIEVEEYLFKQLNNRLTKTKDVNNYEDESCHAGGGVVWSEEWENVCYPGPNFNAIYLPLHAAQHFIYSGASLKQLVDWPMFLKRCGRDVNWDEVYALADNVGCIKWIDVLNAIAVDKFGISVECIGGEKRLVVRDERLEDKVLRAFVENVDIDKNAPFLKLFALKTAKQFRYRWKHELVYNENFWKSYIKHSFGYIKRKIKKWNTLVYTLD